MTEPNIFNQFIVWPIVNLLMLFYKPLAVLGVPGALGFSIILLTAAIRLLLYPLNLKQLRSARQMQQLKPKVDKLAKKYKDDKKKLQQEQLKLYQKHGVNPAAGCLPTLLQLPILIGLYRVFLQILGNGNLTRMVAEINKVLYFPFLAIQRLEPDFFGVSLGVSPATWRQHGAWLLLLPVATAALSYFQARMMQSQNTPPAAQKTNNKKDDDFASIMQTQMQYLFPLMIGWISFRFPLGLSLYWNTFTVFGIIQQFHVKHG